VFPGWDTLVKLHVVGNMRSIKDWTTGVAEIEYVNYNV
jgi:hypothetical protein